MPTQPAQADPIDTAAKAVSALLKALGAAPTPAAAIAYRSALTRVGRNLRDTVGPDALAAVLQRLRADAPDKAAAEDRERIVREAWAGITASKDQVA